MTTEEAQDLYLMAERLTLPEALSLFPNAQILDSVASFPNVHLTAVADRLSIFIKQFVPGGNEIIEALFTWNGEDWEAEYFS